METEMTTKDPRPPKSAPTKDKRRWIERRILDRAAGRREVRTEEFSDLGNMSMVRARLRAMAKRGDLTRVSTDVWVVGTRLTERDLFRSKMSRTVVRRQREAQTSGSRV
jgi:hypothetical protein